MTAPNASDHTFAFVDLAGFTALTEAHGDDAAVGIVDAFVDITRRATSGRGELVKTIGDAVMLAFDSPSEALSAVGELLRGCADHPTLPAARAGMHHGPALRRGDDWFGATVNLAARVAAQAAGGQTLATAAIAAEARSAGIPTVDLGCFALRNVAEPVEIFQIELVAPADSRSIDPVCRMEIAHAAAAGRLRHDGTDLWFCSFECVKAFVADPSRYNGPA